MILDYSSSKIQKSNRSIIFWDWITKLGKKYNWDSKILLVARSSIGTMLLKIKVTNDYLFSFNFPFLIIFTKILLFFHKILMIISEDKWNYCFPWFRVIISKLFLIGFMFLQCPANHFSNWNCSEQIRTIASSHDTKDKPP